MRNYRHIDREDKKRRVEEIRACLHHALAGFGLIDEGVLGDCNILLRTEVVRRSLLSHSEKHDDHLQNIEELHMEGIRSQIGEEKFPLIARVLTAMALPFEIVNARTLRHIPENQYTQKVRQAEKALMQLWSESSPAWRDALEVVFLEFNRACKIATNNAFISRNDTMDALER